MRFFGLTIFNSEAGHALDPETGLDCVRDVAISRGSVSKIDSDIPSAGSPTLDISGMVVAPGFIDLHSHANSVARQRLQACDGVTSSHLYRRGQVTNISQRTPWR